MTLDTSVVVALAALAGSMVGGCVSVATTVIGQRLQARWSRLATELDEQQELYGRFVEEAGPLFIDALEQPTVQPAKIMRLYSIMARIRLTSSDEVLHAAEQTGKQLLEAYAKPPVDPVKFLGELAQGKQHLDPLLEFTEACRHERAKILQQI